MIMIIDLMHIAYLRQDESELQRELDWASKRPASLWSQTAKDSASTPSIADETAFESCLTKSELDFLRGYEQKCSGGICSLNQNPDVLYVASDTQAWIDGPTAMECADV